MRLWENGREEEKSPEARAPKFVGALKVAPKLVASDQKIGRSWMLATGLEGLKFVPQKWGTFMFVPQVPQMGYKWGTQKGPHTFFRRFGYYALYAL